VGVYALAVFMSAIMDAPGTALEKIAFPKVAEAITNNKMEEVKKIYYDSSKYLLLLGCFLFTMIYVNIDFFYYLVPEIYSEGKYAVLLLCVASLFNLATGVNNSIIFNSRKYYWGSIFLFLLIVLAIVNNIYLIPIMGLSGAALAMAISIFVYNFLKYIYIWWHWKLQPFEWSSLKSIFVLMLCISVNKFVPNGSNAIFSIMIHTSIIGSVFLLLTHLTNIAPELYMPYVKKWFEKN
jgi:O-antigen/teichoic acid export membrane protein